ncbi:hypothetical protein LRP52_48045 [Photobacterium sp. ZSDE20]|uniref:Uncharacterized protein n=1 Tax=Photobacterium pectinilyticum TaxID=2906793 RepID=A0ABT1N9B0_9GAMM|nr:hypothetical protein [Photobacterium sp. ZSDE20]MCQ1061311.1 hypothetical protein [Photobacterium sp. ZSDE20]MDD1829895.1 hypothetical protein [Photobacterium sp. ZSDE20]
MTQLSATKSSPYLKKTYAQHVAQLIELKGYSGFFALHGAKVRSGLRCSIKPNRHYLFVVDGHRGQSFAFYTEQTLKRVFAEDIDWQRNHKQTNLPYSSWSPFYIKLTEDKLRQADVSSHCSG